MKILNYLLFFNIIAFYYTYGSTELKDQTLQGEINEDGKANYYHYVIPEQTQSKENLIITTIPNGEKFSDPDLLISSKNEQPNISNAEYKCMSYGKDICIIPASQIEPNKTFNIAVFCEKKCSYNITAYLADAVSLYDGQVVSDTLKTNEVKVFTFKMPDNSRISSLNIDAAFDTSYVTQVDMKVSMSRKEDFKEEVQIKPIPTWFGMGTKIYQDKNSTFCQGCYYKVTLTSQTDSDYHLSFTTNQGIKVMAREVELYEIVGYGEKNCYEYLINNEEDVNIDIETFSGEITLHVNPDNNLDDLQKFKWNITGTGSQSLKIQSEEIKKINPSAEVIYICIFGTYSSSYLLHIDQEEHNKNRQIDIYTGQSKGGVISTSELIVYFHEVWDNEKITYNLVSNTGDADLYVKYCKQVMKDYEIAYEDCELTQENMGDQKVNKSQSISQLDQLIVDAQPGAYLIGVYAARESHYTLQVIGQNQQEISLMQSESDYGIVEIKQSQYYSFYIGDSDIEKIKIQLTCLIGDADMYASRTQPYCNSSTADEQSSQVYGIPDTIEFTKDKHGDLSGKYHITVYGYTYSLFTIMYTVYRKNQKTTQEIMLFDGVPQRGTFNGTEVDPLGLRYIFYVSSKENEGNSAIRISCTSLAGMFRVYIKVNQQPTKQDYDYVISPFESSISITHDNSQHNVAYHILVDKIESEFITHQSFIIKYSTANQLVNIIEGVPERGSLYAEEAAYYQFFVDDQQQDLEITVTPIVGDPDLYISVNPNNEFPNNEHYDYESSNYGEDTVRISMKEFKEKNPFCLSDFNSNYMRCTIFIAVIAYNDECQYSLTVKQAKKEEQQIYNLLDGEPFYGTLCCGQPQCFKYIPAIQNVNQTIEISVNSQTRQIKLYGKIVNPSHNWRDNPDKCPDKDDAEYRSQDGDLATIMTIDSEKFKNCGSNCFILISLVEKSNLPEFEENEYTITATSQIRKLIEGETIIDVINEEQYKYYRFPVTCEDCTISLSLTPLSDGDPDLLVNRGTDLPNLEQYHFISSEFRGDFLQINKDDSVLQELGLSFRGVYTIAVYGFQACTYSLSVSTKSISIQEISIGIPLRYYTREGEITYFQFRSHRKESIKIQLETYFGLATIRVNNFNNITTNQIQNYLPNTDSKSKWKKEIRFYDDNQLIINSDDSNFLPQGTYIIGIEAFDDILYELSVEYTGTSQQRFIKLAQPYRIDMDDNQEYNVQFVANKREDLIITMNVMDGQVSGTVSPSTNEIHKWQLSDSSYTQIKATDNNFIQGTYLIKLKCQERAQVTITVEQGRFQFIQLNEGVPQIVTATKSKNAYLYFRIPESVFSRSSTSSASVFLNVKTRNMQIMTDLGIEKIGLNKKRLPKKEESIDFDKSEMPGHITASLRVSKNEDHTLAIGLFPQFRENDSDELSVEYEVSIFVSELLSLVPNSQQLNEFHSENDQSYPQPHIYQVQLRRDALVEVINCQGKVKFCTSDSQSTLNHGLKENYSHELNGRITQLIKYDVNKPYLYIKVDQIAKPQIEKDQNTKYSIKVRTDSFINNQYQVGNFGQIKGTDLDEHGEMKLSWSKVRILNQAGEADAMYSIYMSSSNETNMLTSCGILMGNTKLLKDNIQTNEADLRLDMHELRKEQIQQVYMNIIAKVENTVLVYVPYTLQVTPGRGFGLIGYIVIGLLVLLVLFVIFYCYKQYGHKTNLYQPSDMTKSNISTAQELTERPSASYTQVRLSKDPE